MSKPPATIIIAPHTYTVTADKELDVLGRSVGVMLPDPLEIRYAPRLALGSLRETLLHEALHAIAEQLALKTKMGDDAEELLVAALAPRILALLRDNPALVKFLVAP